MSARNCQKIWNNGISHWQEHSTRFYLNKYPQFLKLGTFWFSYMKCGVDPFHSQPMVLSIMRVDVIVKTSHAPRSFVFHIFVCWVFLLNKLQRLKTNRLKNKRIHWHFPCINFESEHGRVQEERFQKRDLLVIEHRILQKSVKYSQ